MTKKMLELAPIGETESPAFKVDDATSATIGRTEDCEIQIVSGQISKAHARVTLEAGRWSIVDLESRNGTAVNRWSLSPNDPIILHDGDELAFGPCTFRVKLPTPPVSAVFPATATAKTPPLTRANETYATHASIFLRLRDASPEVQAIGWEEFRGRYAPVILGYCRNAGLPAQDGEDVLQDVMLSFFRLAPEFEYDPTRGRFRGYLKRATLNTIRKRVRRQPKLVGGSDEWLEDQSQQTDNAWDEHWSEQLYARAVSEAERRVDQRTFEAFDLYAQRGMPADAVAERLGLTANGVHQAKSRVLGLVRTMVERLRGDEG